MFFSVLKTDRMFTSEILRNDERVYEALKGDFESHEVTSKMDYMEVMSYINRIYNVAALYCYERVTNESVFTLCHNMFCILCCLAS